MPLVRDVGRRSTQLLDLQCDLSLGGDERALRGGLELEGFFLEREQRRSHPESKLMMSEQPTSLFLSKKKSKGLMIN